MGDSETEHSRFHGVKMCSLGSFELRFGAALIEVLDVVVVAVQYVEAIQDKLPRFDAITHVCIDPTRGASANGSIFSQRASPERSDTRASEPTRAIALCACDEAATKHPWNAIGDFGACGVVSEF